MLSNPLTVGLLPLYVELYDLAFPALRADIESFRDQIAERLRALGLDVRVGQVCRLEPEFAAAIKDFEQARVDAIVTLHLAYSPSLECEVPLSRTHLPVIVLDTTPAERFDETTDPSALMLNHGIHGVQDMCNRLIRRGKRFAIHAGSWRTSAVLQQVVSSVRAAAVVTALRNMRVGLVGGPFPGMGDFRVEADEFRRTLGPEIVLADGTLPLAAQQSAELVAAEDARYRQRFTGVENIDTSLLDASIRAGLVLRKWADTEHLGALAVNFLAVSTDNASLPVMPFVEMCLAMERGIGYAGEGDVLTAAWTGALLRVFPQTSFTEMFCPDWAGDAVFLSHMGELNYCVAPARPHLTAIDFPYTNSARAVVGCASYMAGAAVCVNLAPFGQGRYRVVIAPGHVRRAATDNTMSSLINGWFVPNVGLGEFLERFSLAGGTHHGALIYADPIVVTAILRSVGALLGCPVIVIEDRP